MIVADRAKENLFRALGGDYHRLAFSQNLWGTYLLGQFADDIEQILPTASFSLVNEMVGGMFPGDVAAAHRAFDDYLIRDDSPPGALVLGLAARVLFRRATARVTADEYLRGPPRTGNYPIYFRLKDVFDGLIETVAHLTPPSLFYLHIWSPHAPYRPSGEFDQAFLDGWRTKPKPDHLLGDHREPRHMNERRREYDEYIADLDAEFGRLLDFLEEKGLLQTSYVIVTSDHGELFERGVEGHITPLLYDPVVRVPLLISAPGQNQPQTIESVTASVDLVPTLARIAGTAAPPWCEGQLLPGLGGAEDSRRRIFIMDAKENPPMAPLRQGTFALRTQRHKLIYYRGLGAFGGDDQFELYDVDSDPQELNDLYPQNPSLARSLRDELLTNIEAADKSFAQRQP